MYQHELIEKLYGKTFSEKYNNFINDLLDYEKHNNFFSEENPIGNYVMINKDPHLFTVLFKTDLPDVIKSDLQSLADSYFK